jgi:hypothetical protein
MVTSLHRYKSCNATWLHEFGFARHPGPCNFSSVQSVSEGVRAVSDGAVLLDTSPLVRFLATGAAVPADKKGTPTDTLRNTSRVLPWYHRGSTLQTSGLPESAQAVGPCCDGSGKGGSRTRSVASIQAKALSLDETGCVNSPTFGRHACFQLSDANQQMVFVQAGFAHGFCVLSDVADDDGGIAWDDPALGIHWPVAAPIGSGKDQVYPRLAEIPPDRLPAYRPMNKAC